MSNSATRTPRGDPLVGSTFGGRYTIIRRAGHGGFGDVYLARDVQERRDVAIRLPAPSWIADDGAIARFDEEAKRLRDVRHPNIAATLDHGREHGRAYLVTEYCEGELLSDFIGSRGPLDLQLFVPIAAQLLKGIGHAHSRELAVRDLSPTNILLCERKGRANFVKLLEFGFARLPANAKPVTQEHAVGTAGYIAPEVINGDPLDLRADVYAIGAMFYAILCGHLPFQDDDKAQVLHRTVHEDAPSLRAALGSNHEASDGLLGLIHRCLSRDRGKRPADANELVEALIDVVPAALFRLPRIAPAPSAGAVPVSIPGTGNTGMVELVGTAAKTGAFPDVAPEDSGSNVNELRAVASPLPASRPAHGVAPPPLAQSDPNQSRSSRGPLIAVAAIAVLCVLGFAGSLVFADSDPSADAADLVSAAGAGTARQNQSSAAESVDDSAGRQPSSEQVDAAPVPSSPPTEVSVAEASDADPGEAAVVIIAEAVVRSRPLANLSIDGEALGTTPFRGDLSVGTHRIRLTARGHSPWVGTLIVAEDGGEPLQVTLARKNPGRPLKPTAEEPTAPAKAETPVAGNGTPKAKPKSKVFLPTPKSGNGKKSVFLPTKD